MRNVVNTYANFFKSVYTDQDTKDDQIISTDGENILNNMRFLKLFIMLLFTF